MSGKRTFQIALLWIVTFLTTPLYAVCTSVTASSGGFGTVSTQDNNVTNFHLADITVICDNAGDSYKLGIDAGVHGARQLDQSGQSIPYTLFQGSMGAEWGDNGLTPSTYSQAYPLSASGSNTHAVYAGASTKDKTPQGSYNDTVTVTLADSAGTTLNTTMLAINLDLVAFCTLDTSGFGTFGSYPLGITPITNVALGSIAVTCPTSIAYKIGLDKGQHLAGSGKRQMALGGQFIPYTLKYNATEWGDAGLTALEPNYVETYLAPAVTGTGTGERQNFMIYGDAWIENATTIGTYTDTLIVTLVW